MALKIGEIMVVTNITMDNPGKKTKDKDGAPEQKGAAISEEQRLRIIDEAVQQVMDILQRQNER